MAKLLIQAPNGAWCIWYRRADIIPGHILLDAKRIYNLDTNEEFVRSIGEMFSIETRIRKEKQPDVDVDSLPTAETVLRGGMFVVGLKFGNNIIGRKR